MPDSSNNAAKKKAGEVVVMPPPPDSSRPGVMSWTKRIARPVVTDSTQPAEFSTQQQTTPPRSDISLVRRMHWQLRATLPVAFALFNGILLFLLATVGLTMHQRNLVLALAAGGAVAICAALLIGLAIVVGRPMIELQQTIARVRSGDMQARVNFATRNDEIGDIGRNFNAMVQELAENREEIQRLHRTQMSRAEHLATLGELAAGLAHEIRNPLAGISGVIQIVGRDLPADSAARSVLNDVKDEVAHINRIVTDLLETARPKPPVIEARDLNTTVERAVLFARQQAPEHITISLRLAENLPAVEHDSNQLQQIVLNLLLNSIQAIDGAGLVEVEVIRRDDFAGVVVSDTGRGIPAEILPNIFRPFFTTKINGTGLGLSLARRIIEEHNGRIEVVSHIDKGSEFTVLVPIRHAPN